MKPFLLITLVNFYLLPAFSQNKYAETHLGIKVINEYNEKIEFAFGIQSVFRIKNTPVLKQASIINPEGLL